MNLLKGSWLLKILALVFALSTYFYIHNEIDSAEQTAPDPSYKLIKLTAREMPVKVRLATAPPKGYRIPKDSLTATPARVVVIGPEALFEDGSEAETAFVDVSEYTKTSTKRIPLESVAGIHLANNSYLVDVTVPVEKIEPEPAAEPLP